MAKILMELTDGADGNIEVRMCFFPKLRSGQSATPAQAAAIDLLARVNGTNASLESKVPVAQPG